ncbi:Uncharacterized protein TCM_017252 [Theobroma cacao]|uniref:RNase H type-1 domain-containing protein n=1 Tax=Theobroma cacao TaxID=3641 RepID=A0A061ECY5_THECC|nr:Uncharacterized protein TCM_017252 [Theobroma cacao]
MLIGKVSRIEKECGFVNMYAPNEELARRNLWSELVEKMSGRDIMWCLGGDFNTVVNTLEMVIGTVGFSANWIISSLMLSGLIRNNGFSKNASQGLGKLVIICLWNVLSHGRFGQSGVKVGVMSGYHQGRLKRSCWLGMDVLWESLTKGFGIWLFSQLFGPYGSVGMRWCSKGNSGMQTIRGSPGPAGMRGILRDHQGDVKITFSKSVGNGDANLAEILAVREALVVFVASRWKDQYKLIIESDSCNAVKWVQHPDTTPWRLRKWLLHIERLREKLNDWKIQHVFREANQRADALAKEGVDQQSDSLRVFL